MDRYKILGQVAPTNSTDLFDLYSVPEQDTTTVGSVVTGDKASSVVTRTLITSVIATNLKASGSAYFDLLLYPNSTSTSRDGKYFLLYWENLQAAATGTKVFNLGLTLGPGETLKVMVSYLNSVNVTLMGVEMAD